MLFPVDSIDVLGLIGALSVLAAYWMVARLYIAADSVAYLGTSVGGAVMIVIWLHVNAMPGTLTAVVALCGIGIVGLLLLFHSFRHS